MKIEQIRMKGVTTHADTTLDLPDRGVVLVTGSNGSGKSSIVEAVPLALWGKTLRGAVVWNGGDSKSAVEIVADGTRYTRKAKGRTRFAWEGAPTFETTKEAQAAFDAAHGPLDHWRRACVLSTADAASFTTSTDAERKRLLEALTGVEKLEAGYRVALERAREKRREVDAVAREVAILEERVAGIRQRLADAVPPDDAPEPVDVDEGRLAELLSALREVEVDVRNARDQIRQAQRESDTAAIESAAAEKERRRIEADECPTCGQTIPHAMHEAAERLVAEAQAKADKVAAEVEAKVADLEADLADLTSEQRDLSAEIRDLEAEQIKARAAEREAARLAKLDEVRARAASDLANANADLTTAKQRHAAVEVEARTLEAAARVLSTKGVRAHLLARTIAAVEAAANAWLGEICDDRMVLHLKPYGTTKKGDVKDAVALSIEMSANAMLTAEDDEPPPPRDYASASGGERRRIDVALCFALAEVAEGARGESGSTIFADEIFDALDVEGRSRVAKALAKLAEDRCVVVIAHEAALEVRTVAAQHWHVVDGTLGRV